MNLQQRYELACAERDKAEALRAIRPRRAHSTGERRLRERPHRSPSKQLSRAAGQAGLSLMTTGGRR